MNDVARPRVNFLIGGAQKCGTSALAAYLGQHPELGLPAGKEAHVFDSADFDDDFDSAAVDEIYASHFRHCPQRRWYGDATPLYLFHPVLVRRIACYNPAMKWIVLLRHPVDRAISQYRMERRRGAETWPLLPALLLERWRLRRHGDDWSPDSPLRRYSYRSRGDYARQLDELHRHFPGRQILIVKTEELRQSPESALPKVYAFLGVACPEPLPAPLRVFEGEYPRLRPDNWRWRWLAWLMRRESATLVARYGIRLEPEIQPEQAL